MGAPALRRRIVFDVSALLWNVAALGRASILFRAASYKHCAVRLYDRTLDNVDVVAGWREMARHILSTGRIEKRAGVILYGFDESLSAAGSVAPGSLGILIGDVDFCRFFEDLLEVLARLKEPAL